MKKYDLLRSGDNIIRILDIQDDRILMIDCVKHTMPVWRKFESVDSVLSESSDSEIIGCFKGLLDQAWSYRLGVGYR